MIFEVSEEFFKVKIDDKYVEVNIRKSSRARHIAIKINVRGEAILVLPKRVSFSKAQPFLLEKLPWLAKHLASIDKSCSVEHSTILVFGRQHTIKHECSEGKTSVQLNGDVIEITGPKEHLYSSLVQYLKNILLSEVMELVQDNAEKHRLCYSDVRLGRGVSTWGSCSKDNKLSFNWRLVFAPHNILKYLVAHEMAHLKERNHGPRFWKLVKIIYQDSDIARKWLKQNGRSLYQIFQDHK